MMEPPLENNQLDTEQAEDAAGAPAATTRTIMNPSAAGTTPGKTSLITIDHYDHAPPPSDGEGASGKRHGGDSIDAVDAETLLLSSSMSATSNFLLTSSSKKKRKIGGLLTGGSSSSSSSSPKLSAAEQQQQQQYAPTPMNPALLRTAENSTLSRRMLPQLQYNNGSGYIPGSHSADTARAMQMNLLQQQQHALLASKLAQQQQQLPRGAMTTQQQQQLNSNFSPTSFDSRLLSSSPQVGSNFFFGGHGLGAGGSAGLLLQNFRGMAGMGGDFNVGDQAFLQQQQQLQQQLGAFGAGTAGMNPTGNNNPQGDHGHNSSSNQNDASLGSLDMTSTSGTRQLLLMQQALAGGIGGAPAGMLAQHQGQFLGASMQGFSMAENINFAQQQSGFGPSSSMVPPSSSSTIIGNNNFRATTTAGADRGNRGPGSSMTPAGISHQALYARDPSEEDDSSSAEKHNVLYMACDDESLSAYQCLVRKQVQLFDANADDVESNAQGRNRAIILGQVGIRCRHCAKIPPRHRTRGATYYPAKLNGLYQAAQNMASAHLGKHCQLIPDGLRQELLILRDRKSSAGGGKQYWADGVRVLGVIETNNVLRFAGDDEKYHDDEQDKTVVTGGPTGKKQRETKVGATKEKDAAAGETSIIDDETTKQVHPPHHVDTHQV